MKTVWIIFKKLQIELLYDPAIPLLGIYLDKTVFQKDTCTPMFKAALSTMARHGNHPLTDRCFRKKSGYLGRDNVERPQRTETHERSPRSHHPGLMSPQSHTRGLTEEVFKMTPAPSCMQPSKRSQTRTTQPSHTSSRPAETKDKKWLLMLEATQSGDDLSQE